MLGQHFHVVGVVGGLAVDRHRDVRRRRGQQPLGDAGAEQGVAVEHHDLAVELVADDPARSRVVGHRVEGIESQSDGHAEAEPPDLGFHGVGPEAGHAHRLAHSGRLQPQQLPGQQAASGQLDQALGPVLGERQQALALPGGEDDGAVRRSHGLGGGPGGRPL